MGGDDGTVAAIRGEGTQTCQSCALSQRDSVAAFVIARCAKRAVAIQLDCFVATLLAMTGKKESLPTRSF